jgi:hypothetical protein
MPQPQSAYPSCNSPLEHVPIESDLVSLQRSLLTQTQQEIVAAYCQNPSKFAIEYQIRSASVTKDSIHSSWGVEAKSVILAQTDRRGNYWVFNTGDCTYLVPAKHKYIDPNTYTIASWIFEGHNYTPDYLNIELIKPAIVMPLEIDPDLQMWQLHQQGELIFS